MHFLENSPKEATKLLIEWAEINSGSNHLAGLNRMLQAIKESFSTLKGDMEIISLPSSFSINDLGLKEERPSGKALRIRKHPNAKKKILLAGHMDTVFGENHVFQKVRLKDNMMVGPGVADMKGGLLIMLLTLQALEASPLAGLIGWEVLITPDEEIGSQGSTHLYQTAAKRNDIGLVFEPAFPDGAIVTERKGSANFTIVSRGTAAHAGRDFEKGLNAITPLAKIIIEAEKLTDLDKGITINIGHIKGGGPVNIVPDMALCRINARMKDPKDLPKIRNQLEGIVSSINRSAANIALYEVSSRAPKPFDQKNQGLFEAFVKASEELGVFLEGRPSGGACDGNTLSTEGLPTLDSLGVVGGKLHTDEEFMLINSLVERAKTLSHFLFKVAKDEIEISRFKELR